MDSPKEYPMYIGKYIFLQPIVCTKIRVLFLGFSEVLFLILYPLLNLWFWWKPPWHSLKNVLVPTTEPFVGTRADPGFSSNSAPTSPNYWPFRQHLWGRWSLTRSSNRGLQDTCVYNQRKSKWNQGNHTWRSNYSFHHTPTLHSYISYLTY